MEANDLTKEFPSVFQYYQSQCDFFRSLIEVTVGSDMRELDLKICSQFLTFKTVKVMFIIHRFVWLLLLSVSLTMVL